MPDHHLTFGDIEGKLDVLVVECIQVAESLLMQTGGGPDRRLFAGAMRLRSPFDLAQDAGVGDFVVGGEHRCL
jgi:hypothetical protein